MLKFNEYGILPSGIHKVKLNEFEKLFSFNHKRLEMIQKGLTPFLKELKPYKLKEIYMDGSFVTQKENPDDIDGYALSESTSALSEFIVNNQDRWQSEYRIDFNPAFSDFEGEYSQSWWEEFFSSIPHKQSLQKGFVALAF